MPGIKRISWLGLLFFNCSAFCQNELFVSCQDSTLYFVDVSNCSVHTLCKTNCQFYDIAVHPVSGELYGVDDDGYLCIIDTQTCALDTLGFTLADMVALTFSEDGYHLYGMRWGNDDLFEINYSNGSTVSLGSTGTGLDPTGDLTFYNGYLHYSGSDPPVTGNSLVRIDPNDVGNASIFGAMFVSGYGMATLGCESAIYASSNQHIRKLDLNDLSQFNTVCSVPGLINGFAQVLPSVVDGEFSIGNDTTVCDADSLLLNPHLSSGTFLWNDGSTDSVSVVSQSGTYWVEVLSGNCTYRDTVSVFFEENPDDPFKTGDTTLCEGSVLQLNAGNPGSAFLWQDASTDSVMYADTSGIYWVQILKDGCSITDSIDIFFKDCGPDLNVPNVFTPNGDGLNDVFRISHTDGIDYMRTSIANRWGQIIHTTTGKTILWDGNLANGSQAVDGTYYYVIDYATAQGQRGSLSGFLHLIRHAN